MSSALKTVQTPHLEISYLAVGSPTGWPVVLSHGFPYSVNAYASVAPLLASQGAFVIIPYVRGFGPTRFLSATAKRNGQQAALGADIVALLDALGIERAVLAGFDWGGLASCVAVALWPERVAGLVSYAGYDIVDREGQKRACEPALERVMWYQHLFQSERGRECLARHRDDLCRRLWEEWSPSWKFSEETWDETRAAFANEDFVDVVTHCYRFVLGSEEGDPELEGLERRLAERPKIQVPTITLDGTLDPLKPGGSGRDDGMFTGRHERRVYEVGHAFPYEAPREFAEAVLQVHQWAEEQGR